MHIDALKKSMIEVLPIYGILSTILVAAAYQAGNILSTKGGSDFVILTLFFTFMMFLSTHYFAYKVAEIYYIDKIEQVNESFSRYDGAII